MMILIMPYFIVSDVEDDTVDLRNFSKGCLSQELTKNLKFVTIALHFYHLCLEAMVDLIAQYDTHCVTTATIQLLVRKETKSFSL